MDNGIQMRSFDRDSLNIETEDAHMQQAMQTYPADINIIELPSDSNNSNNSDNNNNDNDNINIPPKIPRALRELNSNLNNEDMIPVVPPKVRHYDRSCVQQFIVQKQKERKEESRFV